MDDFKYRHGRLNKGLREIADSLGYTPGEFSLVRFVEDAKTLKRWQAMVDAGTVPEELARLPEYEARRIVRKEIADLIERERAWLPFFYPTLKSTELTGEGGGPVDGKWTVEIVSGRTPTT